MTRSIIWLRPLLFNDSTGREVVRSRDPNTFIGYDENGNYSNTTSKDEQQLAEIVLKDAPPGTKLYCYDYEPRKFKDPNNPTQEIQLSHSFIIKKQEVLISGKATVIDTIFAISNEENKHLIKYDSDEGRRISAGEWQSADQELAGKETNTKLHAAQKVYKHEFIRHCFLKFLIEMQGDKNNAAASMIVLAVAGNGWKQQGGTSTIKSAGDKFAIKIPFKRTLGLFYYQLQKECVLSINTGLFISSANKQNNFKQPLYLMQLHQKDFLYYIVELGKNYDTLSESEKLAKKSECYIILIKAIKALQALHQKKILHCDVKLENILLSDSNGAVTVCLADLGFANNAQNGEYRSHITFGTKRYLAPELQPSANSKNYRFTEASDVYAMGIAMACIYKKIFFNTDQTLKTIAYRAINAIPLSRANLCFLELALIFALHDSSKIAIETLLNDYGFPLKTERCARSLYNLFMSVPEEEYRSFHTANSLVQYVAIEKSIAASKPPVNSTLRPR